MNKRDMILKYMLDGNSITSLEAIEKFGATRLSAIIFDFKNKYEIKDCWETSIDRYGREVKFKRYSIVGKRDLQKEAKSWLDWMRIRK